MKKFNIFTVRVYWKVNDENQVKLTVPHVVSFGMLVHSMIVNIKETACDFLYRARNAYLTGHEIEKIDEIEIGFVSDLKDITFNHFLNLPKPMICRKTISRFVDVKSEDLNDFENIWIPVCL